MLNTGFLDRCTDPGGKPFQVYVPRHYTPRRSWPLILFLHGAGEGGCDGRLQTEFQLGSAIRRHSHLFDAIAVFPQQDPCCYWGDRDQGLAMACLEQIRQEFCIDSRRISLCGVSSGAIAAWALAAREPQRFARLLIVAGLVSPAAFVPADGAVVPPGEPDPHRWLAERLQHTPIWIHHGDTDPLYPVSDARRTVAWLKRLQAPVRYSELPGFGHNVWDAAFYSETVLGWLLANGERD